MLIDVVPPRLTEAAAPLRAAAEDVRRVADHRRELLDLLDGVASPVVREALAEALQRWELVAWAAAQDAATLAVLLEQAAAGYLSADARAVRR